MKKSLKNLALVMILGLLLLSAGCGGAEDYYDLSGYTPEGNGSFTSFVDDMVNPSTIASWIRSNCSYQISYESVKSPYEFWDEQIGDCSEAAALCSYCLHEHHCTTYQTYILYTNDKAHRICIYRSRYGYGYFSFHGQGACYPYQHYPSFKACVENWDTRTGYTVAAYAVFNWDGDVIEEESGQEIIDRGIYDGE